MKAVDVMTMNVVTVTPDVSVHEVAKLLLSRHISAVPVVDAKGAVLGIVSEGDLMRRQETGTERRPSWWLSAFGDSQQLAADYVKSHGLKARDVMTSPVVTVSVDTSLGEIATLLERHHIKRVPVVKDGKLVGVVSRANLLQALAAGRPAGAEGADRDREIRERLMAELARQPWVSLAPVNIIVTDGVVHLWGLSRSQQERDAIRVAAENIPGVKKVENHLNLRPMTLYGL